MPRSAGSKGLSLDQLKQLARAGAESALERLRAEIRAIERTFPELASPTGRRAVGQSIAAGRTAAAKRSRQMSAAARKAVSARMKKYWAERRKAQPKAK